MSAGSIWRTQLVKGKPVARRGRKARGLEHEMARLPPLARRHAVFANLFRGAADMRLLLRASLALAAAMSVIVSVAAASPAQAAILSGPTCSQGSLSQPFLAWGDTNSYSLIAGGDFEGSLSSWTLSGGAKLLAGSEPYKAAGALGKYSMSLPPGASALTPFTCVNVAYPTFRFFARNEALASSLLVQVLYKTPLGTLTASLGAVVPAG